MQFSFVNGVAQLQLSAPQELAVLHLAAQVYAQELAKAKEEGDRLARRYLLHPEPTEGLGYDDRLTVRLGCKKTLAYELLNSGILVGRQMGNRWVVDEQEVLDYLRRVKNKKSN